MPVATTYSLVGPPFINQGAITTVRKECTTGCLPGISACSNSLDFQDIPSNISGQVLNIPALHAYSDGVDCIFSRVSGYATLAVDLSPYRNLPVKLSRLSAYSFYNRVPIPSPSQPMKLNLWGPAGVGSDWLNGSGSLFHASVEPSSENSLQLNDYLPNMDLTGLASLVLAPALDSGESTPDVGQYWIAPTALQVLVQAIILTIHVLWNDGTAVSGALVVIARVSDGAAIATAVTDSSGTATVKPLLSDSYSVRVSNPLLPQDIATLSAAITPTADSALTVTFTKPTRNESRVVVTGAFVQDPVLGRSFSLSGHLKMQGDVNGDGVVNFLDEGLIGAAFFSTPARPNWNPEADLNQDGVVNFVDLGILGTNFQKSTDPGFLDNQTITIQFLMGGVWQDLTTVTTVAGTGTHGLFAVVVTPGLAGLPSSSTALRASFGGGVFGGNLGLYGSVSPPLSLV